MAIFFDVNNKKQKTTHFGAKGSEDYKTRRIAKEDELFRKTCEQGELE